MRTSKRIAAWGVLGLGLLAVGCSGNDANRCKVSTLNDGSVRVSCPGNTAILIPPGEDSFSLPEECEATENPTTGVIELVCQGQSASLGECGLGIVGDIILSEQPSPAPNPDEPFPGQIPIGAEKSDELIARFRALSCSRILGTVSIGSGGASKYADVLNALEYASTIRFLDPELNVELPSLRSAHIDFTEYPASLATLQAPLWTSGGITVVGGTFEGELRVPSLVSGDVRILDIAGLRGFELTSFENGAVDIARASELEFVRLPSMVTASSIGIREVESLEELSVPELSFAGSMDFYGLPSLVSLALPKLERVVSHLGISNLESLASLSMPSLEVAGGLDVQDMLVLPALELPSLRNVGYSNIWDNGALVSISAPLLERAGSLQVKRNPLLTTVTFTGLRQANTLVLDELRNLRSFDLSALVAVGETLSLVGAGMDVSNGIVFSAPRLETAPLTDFYGANFSEVDLPVFRTGNLAIYGGEALTRIVVPNLTDSALYVSLAGTPADRPVVIDVTNFSYTSASTNHLRSLEVFAEFGRTIDFRMDSLVNLADMHVYGLTFTEPWIIPSGQMGILSMSLVLQGSMIDLSQASGLQRVEFTNVGTLTDRVHADFSASRLVMGQFLAVHFDDAKFQAVDSGRIAIFGYDDQHPSSAIGALEIMTSSDEGTGFRVVLDPNGDQSAATSSLFSSVIVGNVPDVSLEIYSAESLALDLSAVQTIRDLILRTPNLTSLNLASLEASSGEGLDIEGLPPTSATVLPSVPAPSVQGTITGDWSTQICPSFFDVALPSVIWNVTCQPNNGVEPG